MYLALRRAKKAASIRRPPRTYPLNKSVSAVDDVDMGSSVDAPTGEISHLNKLICKLICKVICTLICKINMLIAYSSHCSSDVSWFAKFCIIYICFRFVNTWLDSTHWEFEENV